MKAKKVIVVVALVFLVVMIGATVLYRLLGGGGAAGQLSGTESSAGPEASASQEPVDAPDFTVYDREGNPVRLSDYAGKPVVLNFWASWCPPCKSEMPDFEEACAQYGGDIHFMMVNSTDGSRETVDTASAYLADNGYTFPAYFDTDFEASTAYGVTGLPTTFFIDSEGYLVAYARGALNAETLQTGIDMLLPQD